MPPCPLRPRIGLPMSLRTRAPSLSSRSVHRTARQGAVPGPAAVPYLLFVIYPIFYVIVLSLFRWDGISPDRPFVGLDNYVTLLTKDPIFWVALKNSLTWTVLSLTIPTTLGLGLALVLNQPFRGRTLLSGRCTTSRRCSDRSPWP